MKNLTKKYPNPLMSTSNAMGVVFFQFLVIDTSAPCVLILISVLLVRKKDLHPASHPLLKLKEPARRDIHHGVSCDECGMKPIEGVRYKCLRCPNFDLCSKCEEKNQHPSDHTLLKLKEHRVHGGHGRVGGGSCGRGRGFGGRGFGPLFFGPHAHHGPHRGPHGHGFFGLLKSLGLFGGSDHKGDKSARHAEKCARRAEKCLGKEEMKQEKLTRRAEKCTRKAEAVQEKCARRAEKCARRVEKWSRSGSKCHRRKCETEFAADFVEDINIRDGAILVPGGVVKQWRLKNTGSTKWPEGSKAIFLRGARELLGEQEEFSVPLAEPGHSVDITVPLLVPEKAGKYAAKFQLADKDRNVFGHRFWVEFTVKEEEKLRSSAPVSSPVKEASLPVKEVKEAPLPVKEAPLPVKEAPLPVKEAPLPVKEAPLPVKEAPLPVKEAKEGIKEVDVKETKKVVQGLASTIPVPPTPSKHASSLGVLEKMGFVNEKLNSSLLDRSQGNIEQVVTWLLEMENSMPVRV